MAHGRNGDGKNDVRRERNQFRCVSAQAFAVARAIAGPRALLTSILLVTRVPCRGSGAGGRTLAHKQRLAAVGRSQVPPVRLTHDRLPAMAADLVHRDVSVIAAISGTPSALAAKSATTTIPIVFAMGSDPVTSGLVASLNRPEGNVTGVTFFTATLANKRLEIIRELAPGVTRIAVLVNPDNPPSMQEGKDASGVAQATGLHITA